MASNIVIITGASSGIGYEFFQTIDTHFCSIDEIWVIARTRPKLLKMKEQAHHNVRVIAMDLTKEGQLERLEDLLEEKNAIVRMLINCAGYGLTGNFATNEKEGQLGMIRLNDEALTHLTYSVLPYLRKHSRIIQMASSAAFLPQPGFAVYAATKAYVLSFSRALHEELKSKGIIVTAVCPGPVDTPFFDVADQTHTDSSLEKVAKLKKMFLISPTKVVKKALLDSYHKKPVSVIGIPMKVLQICAKILPHRLLLSIETMGQKTGESTEDDSNISF
ncbi:MAG: SDR family NAD(P)-dependent oxidoreductase [Lachnospiraceae bacterium]|jgi:short-subunit dehydrogenase|nr:SDR family NAD(P)-dependent oxidoreductase [Lachnospiraceae bacterium]